MTIPQSPSELRLWPGVAAVALQWLLRYVVPAFYPDALLAGVIGGVAFGVVVLVWWTFFSRAPWLERIGAILFMIASLLATSRIVHPSIATGMMGLMLLIYAIPTLCLAFVMGVVITGNLSTWIRRPAVALAILLGCAVWALVRTEGMTGDAVSDFKWRWAPSAEDRLVASAAKEPFPPPPAPAAAPAAVSTVENKPDAPAKVDALQAPVATAVNTGSGWSGFRGPNRNDSLPGVRIETDWSKKGPKEMWRRPVGPGWSSFAVQGSLLYTQEQRGPDEVVSCYNVATGKPVWQHSDQARFWESNAGAGPRATPTFFNGRLYTFGATGIMNALDAQTGAVIWTRNVGIDNGVKVPEWGFASSPLVIGDQVVIAVAGKLAGYDIATGAPRWTGPDGGGVSYSSPQLVSIGGVNQILLLGDSGAVSVSPTDGSQLWKHDWHGYPIVQPAQMPDGDILMSVSDSSGTRRLAVTHEGDSWKVQERWTSKGLKPYFNDFVVHQGYAYGFDGSILACIDLQDGKRVWKGGRYGHGQLILLPSQNALLVLSEEGEVAMVSADPEKFTELAKMPAIDGKTWNHPVLAGEVLLVRNGQEMAAFRMSLLNH